MPPRTLARCFLCPKACPESQLFLSSQIFHFHPNCGEPSDWEMVSVWSIITTWLDIWWRDIPAIWWSLSITTSPPPSYSPGWLWLKFLICLDCTQQWTDGGDKPDRWKCWMMQSYLFPPFGDWKGAKNGCNCNEVSVDEKTKMSNPMDTVPWPQQGKTKELHWKFLIWI